jgi:hypothetical protein
MKLLSTLVLMCATICASAQSNYVTTGKSAGEWNDARTWELAPGSTVDADQDGIPDANDNVTILSGHTLIVKSNQVCKTLTLDDQGDFTELVVDPSGNLDVLSDLSINSPLKTSEVLIDVRGALNAHSTSVQSFGQDMNVELKVRKTGSFMVAAVEVKSVNQLSK